MIENNEHYEIQPAPKKERNKDDIAKAMLAGLVIGGAIVMVLTNHEIPGWVIIGVSTILVYYFGLSTNKPQ